MPNSKNMIFLQGANLVVFLVTVVVNGLSNVLPMNGKTVGEISDLYSNLFTPAAYVFSIWVIIYTLLFAFAVYQALPRNREKIFLREISALFVLSNMANIVWIFLWLYEQIVLSLIPMLALLVTLIVIYLRLQIGRSNISLKEKLLVHLPFSVYLGWITVALISNVAAALTAINWDGFGFGEVTWTILVIIVTLIISIAIVFARKDAAFSLVIVWALGGIIAKQIENQIIVLAATVGAIIIVTALILRMILSRAFAPTFPRLTPGELAKSAKLLRKTKLLKENEVLVEYWKKVKETIHLFDEIIVKYVIQWAAILLAIVGGSALVFCNSTPEIDFSLLAGIVALSAILISIPIAVKCWFYYQLLEEALRVAEDIEKVMFDNDADPNLAKELGLTLRLTRISTKTVLGIKFFGWTILLPFAFLFAISLLLMLYYFSHFFGVL